MQDDGRNDVPTSSENFWRSPRDAAELLPELTPGSLPSSELALLADNIPTLCWVARGDGYIVWYNRRWHEYCGSTPAAMEGWGWQDVHDPDALPAVIARWTACIAAGEPFEMVFPLRGADAVFRPFLTRIAPMRDASGKVARWFGVNTEVGAQVRAEKAHAASEAKYDVLTEAMPQMVWSTLPDGYHDYYNRQWYEFTGVPLGSTDGEGWNGLFHPEDQDRAWARWRRSLASGEPYEIEYRLRHHSGVYRWTLGRALPVRDENGVITRWIGTCTDIDDAKRAADQNEILTQELSHRIKNIFAIIASLIRISARRDATNAPFARDLLDRIQALGRAHEFARPHSESSRPIATEMSLQGLLREVFLPYARENEPVIVVHGDDTAIDDKSATPLALLFHELATNAIKYGALSQTGGVVDLNITSTGEALVIVWRETGGPPITAEPAHRGFGTRLALMSIEQQLGGTIDFIWEPAGLVVRTSLQQHQLVREKT
jgi:PAS domain S-box-containing protein